eukprot:1354320-Pleurochrysis_carterae.AAC.2
MPEAEKFVYGVRNGEIVRGAAEARTVLHATAEGSSIPDETGVQGVPDEEQMGDYDTTRAGRRLPTCQAIEWHRNIDRDSGQKNNTHDHGQTTTDSTQAGHNGKQSHRTGERERCSAKNVDSGCHENAYGGPYAYSEGTYAHVAGTNEGGPKACGTTQMGHQSRHGKNTSENGRP